MCGITVCLFFPNQALSELLVHSSLLFHLTGTPGPLSQAGQVCA